MPASEPGLATIALRACETLWACIFVWALIFVAGLPLLLLLGQVGLYILYAITGLVVIGAPCALVISLVCGIGGVIRHAIVDDAPRRDLLRSLLAVGFGAAGGMLAWWALIFEIPIRATLDLLGSF